MAPARTLRRHLRAGHRRHPDPRAAGYVDCRVHLKNGDYLDWVRFGKSYKDGADGYAGILGRAIDGVQMK